MGCELSWMKNVQDFLSTLLLYMLTNRFLKSIFPQKFWKNKVYFLMKFSTSLILNSVEHNKDIIVGLCYCGRKYFLVRDNSEFSKSFFKCYYKDYGIFIKEPIFSVWVLS